MTRTLLCSSTRLSAYVEPAELVTCASCNARCNDIFMYHDESYCSKWCRSSSQRGLPETEEQSKCVDQKAPRLSTASTAPTEREDTRLVETHCCGDGNPKPLPAAPAIKPVDSPPPPPPLELDALAPYAEISNEREERACRRVRTNATPSCDCELEPVRFRCGRVHCGFCDRLYNGPGC